MNLPDIFEQYLKHGLYLKGWSPKTVAVYRRAFGSLPKQDDLTKGDLEAWVVGLREQGREPTCINIYIRAMNAFFHWAFREELLPKRLNTKQVSIPHKQLKGMSDQEVARIISFRPTLRNTLRTWALIQLLLDTGLRIDEAVSSTVNNLDLDNLYIKVRGKGNKERIVPISIECRKIMFRYLMFRSKEYSQSQYVFCTRSGSLLSYRNVYRDIKTVCARAGVVGEHIHPHSFRHKFATTYIRKGGDIYRLSRILGHSSVSTTEIYLRSMGIEQVGENHSRLTPLARG